MLGSVSSWKKKPLWGGGVSHYPAPLSRVFFPECLKSASSALELPLWQWLYGFKSPGVSQVEIDPLTVPRGSPVCFPRNPEDQDLVPNRLGKGVVSGKVQDPQPSR